MPIDSTSGLFYAASFAFLFAVLLESARRANLIRKQDRDTPLSDRMEKAVHYFRQDPRRGEITNDMYQKLTGVSDSTATRDLEKLEELGFLERRGETRGTYYLFTPRTTEHIASHSKKIGS